MSRLLADSIPPKISERKMIKKVWLLLALVATAAFAATVWGPVPIMNLGYEYVTMGLRQDMETDYAGANRLANISLAGTLNTPAKITKALKEDYFRVMYADGNFVDFRIRRWPSAQPLDYYDIATSKDQKRLSEDMEVRRQYAECMMGAYSSGWTEIWVPTGYWGWTSETEPSPDGFGRVTTTGGWIDTGGVAVWVNTMQAQECP